MSEIVLQGYVDAKGGDPQSAPIEPTAKTKGSVGLYIAFKYPNRNDDLDPDGLPQPVTPPVEVQYVETRFTYDERAATDPFNENITWTFHQKVAPKGPSASLQDPNQDYDPDSNDYEGFTGEVVIRPLIIKAKIFFQMRTISRSGVPSEWTDVVKLEMNPDPENETTGMERMPCGEDSVLFIPGNTV